MLGKPKHPNQIRKNRDSPVYRPHEPDRQEAHDVDVDAGLAAGDEIHQKNHKEAEDSVDERHLWLCVFRCVCAACARARSRARDL